MKFTFIMLLTFFVSLAHAEPGINSSQEVYDALMNAMRARSLESQSTTAESNNPDDSQADSNTCLWGGWISTRDDEGNCQQAFRLDVYNDPFIKNFGPTYDATMRCGAESLYRCNPVIFGTGSGRDSKGYCVNIPQVDSALLMNACREASRANASAHLEKLKTDPELLANYISQVAEIGVQCRQGGSTCGDFVEAISREVKPALTCHQEGALYPYMSATLSSTNLEMINELTGSLGTQYNTYIESLVRDRNAAIEHNRGLMEQAIAQYSESDGVSRMFARLESNFTVHYNRSRRRVGSKAKGRSVGRCLMYAKLALVSGGFFRQYPSEMHAKDFGPHLTRAGFTNLMQTEGFENITPETAPKGAVIVYSGGTSGHIEMKMEDGGFGSDHWNDVPINDYLARRPIGIYVKIPDTIDGMVEVPNE